MNGTKKAWDTYWKGLDDGLRMAGSLLFFPFFLIVGIGYGLRAGIIEGLKRILKQMEEWE
jgi:hypothetical protein